MTNVWHRPLFIDNGTGKRGGWMFGLNLGVDSVLDSFCDWIYGMLIGFFGDFFSMINMMGAELFEMDWIQALLLFFTYFAWALYAVGIVVAVFDFSIEYQKGRGSIQDVCLNAIKGFFAVSLFTVAPVDLYVYCINMSDGLIRAIGGLTDSPGKLGAIAQMTLGTLSNPLKSVLVTIVFVILIGYATIKVFFSNLKRGGILLALMALGSLYMFSVPRGYLDGFTSWCKQVIGLCMTAFLQTLILIAGLVTYNTNMLLGIGLMLSATEIPRIAQSFGLDTSSHVNIMSAVYSTQSAIGLARTVKAMVK